MRGDAVLSVASTTRPRAVARIVLACFCLLAFGANVRAEEPYPSKPIRLILPQPAGGAVDLIARALGDRLSESMRQPVIVENMPGANGGLAAGQVARATPDGHTLFMAVDTNLVVNPSLYPNLAYDPFRDFIPISIIAKVYLVLVASPKVEINSVQELLAFARANPGKLNYASIGLGTQAHLGMELLKMMTKTDITQVSYRGTAPAMTDIAAGVVEVMFTGPPSALALAAGGKVKILAVASPTRSQLMPQVPTVQEAGVPGYELSGWFGLLAPAKTPQSVIDRAPDRTGSRDLRQHVRGDARGDDGGYQEMERGHRRNRRQDPAMTAQWSHNTISRSRQEHQHG
jgi:tripartite-type tricarboxylate transporter receptor subunit TctC